MIVCVGGIVVSTKEGCVAGVSVKISVFCFRTSGACVGTCCLPLLAGLMGKDALPPDGFLPAF